MVGCFFRLDVLVWVRFEDDDTHELTPYRRCRYIQLFTHSYVHCPDNVKYLFQFSGVRSQVDARLFKNSSTYQLSAV